MTITKEQFKKIALKSDLKNLASKDDLKKCALKSDLKKFALQKDLKKLETKMDKRFEAVDKRFEAVDKRFDEMDKRFDEVDRKFTHVALKSDLKELEDRLVSKEYFEEKMDIVITMIDGLAKRMDNYEIERLSNLQAHNRLNDNINVVRQKVGMKIVPTV